MVHLNNNWIGAIRGLKWGGFRMEKQNFLKKVITVSTLILFLGTPKIEAGEGNWLGTFITLNRPTPFESVMQQASAVTSERLRRGIATGIFLGAITAGSATYMLSGGYPMTVASEGFYERMTRSVLIGGLIGGVGGG